MGVPILALTPPTERVNPKPDPTCCTPEKSATSTPTRKATIARKYMKEMRKLLQIARSYHKRTNYILHFFLMNIFIQTCAIVLFLEHWITISGILPWDRNLILPRLSYLGCHVRVKYIGCIGTHAHGRQVASLLCKSDVIITYRISAYSGTSGWLF